VALLMLGSIAQAGINVELRTATSVPPTEYSGKDYYLVTAPGLWEMKVLKDTGTIISFKDLTDAGAAAYGNAHQNYLGENPTTGASPAYNFSYGFAELSCRNRIIFGGSYTTNQPIAHRFSYSATGTNLDYFEVTYTEQPDGVVMPTEPTYAFDAYVPPSAGTTGTTHGQVLTTAKMRINAPTASGTVIYLTMDSTNQTVDGKNSNLFAQYGMQLRLRVNPIANYSNLQGLDYDDTVQNTELLDGAWNPADPKSYRKVQVIDGTKTQQWGYTVGRTFITDHVEGKTLDPITWSNGPTQSAATNSPGERQWRYSFPYGGTLAGGATKHYEAQIIINLTVVTIADASDTESTVTVDPNAIANNGTDTSTISITLKSADGQLIKNAPLSQIQVTATDTSGGNIYGTLTEIGNGLYQVTLASTVSEIKTVTVKLDKDGDATFETTLEDTPTVLVYDPNANADATQTICTINPAIQSTNPGQQSTITVQLKDAFGIPLSGKAAYFTIESTGTGNTIGTLTETATLGTYTTTMSSTVGEAKTLTITYDDPINDPVVLTNSLGITFITPYTPDQAQCVVVNTPNSANIDDAVWANGTSVVTVTMTVKDSYGYPILGIASGEFTLSTNRDTASDIWSAVTEVGNGVYTATLACTAPTWPDNDPVKVISVDCRSVTITNGTNNCYFQPVRLPDADQSTVTVSRERMLSNGSMVNVVTLNLKDSSGAYIAKYWGSLVLNVDGNPTAFTFTDLGGGVYTAQYTTSSAGTQTLSVSFDGTPVTQTQSVLASTSMPVLYFTQGSGVLTVTAREADNSVQYWQMTIAETGTYAGQIQSFFDLRGGALPGYGSTTADYSHRYNTDPDFFNGSTTATGKTYVAGAKVDGSTEYSFTTTYTDPTTNVLRTTVVTIQAPDFDGSAIDAVTTYTNNGAADANVNQAPQSWLHDVAYNMNADSRINGQVWLYSPQDIWTLSTDPLTGGTFGSPSATATVKNSMETLANGLMPGLSFTLKSHNVYGGNTTNSTTTARDNHGQLFARLSLSQGISDSALTVGSSLVREASMDFNIAALPENRGDAPDVAQSSVTASVAAQGANGGDEVVIQIVLKDADGDAVVGKADQLVVSSTGTGNTIGAVKEVAYGVYEAAMVSTVAEAKTISVVYGGTTTLTDSLAVTFETPGTAYAANCTVVRDTGTGSSNYYAWANGNSYITVAITVRDEDGYLVTGLTDADFVKDLTLTDDAHEFWTPVTEVAPGLYRTTVASDVADVSGSNKISITCQSVLLSDTLTAYFRAETDLVPVVGNSTVTVDKTVAQADGTDTVTITVAIKNSAGRLLNGLAGYIAISQDGTGTTLSTVTEVAPCIYQATLTGTAIELVTIGAGYDDGTTSFTLTQTPKVQFFLADYANLAACTNTANPTTGIEANGIAYSTITIVMKNHANLPITGLTNADFTITDPYGDPVEGASFTPIIETATPGTYTTIMTGSTTGPKDVMIGYIFSEDETQYIDPYMTITFTDPIPADAWYSRVVNTGAHVIPADGTSTAQVTITLRDNQAAHNLIANALVLNRLTVTVDGTDVTNSVTESSPGVYTFTYASNVASIKPVVVTYDDGVNTPVVLDDLELYFQITTPMAKLVYSGDDISAYCTPAQRAYLIIPAAEIPNVAGLVTIAGNGGSFEYDFGTAGSQTAASIVAAISANEDATLVEAYESGGAVYMRSFSSGMIDLTDQTRGYSDSAFVKVTLGAGGVCATTDLNGVPASEDYGVSPKTRIVRCVNISDPTDVRWELHVTRNGNDFIFSHFYDMTDDGLPGGGHFDYVGRQGDRWGRATGLFRVHTMSDAEFNPAQPTAASLITESESELKFQVENGGSPLSFVTEYTVRPSTNLGGTITAVRTLTNVSTATVDLNVVAGAIQAMNSASYLGVGPYNGRAYDETTNPFGSCGLRPFYDANLYRYQYTAGDDHAFGVAGNDDDGNGTVDDASEAGYGDDQPALWKFTDMLDRTNHAFVDTVGTGLVNFPWPVGTTVDPYQVMWADAEIMASDAAASQGLVAGRSFAMGTDILGYYPGGDSTFGDIRMGGTAAAYWDGFVMENVNREWWGTARGSYMVPAGGTVTKNFMLVWNIDQGEGAPVPELAISASLDYDWVYPNTPVTTQNRHKSVLSVNITSGKVDGETYAVTVGENGGAVTNFQVTQPVDISSGSATVDILGGLRTTAVPGTYTLNVSVTGGSLGQAATQDVTLKLRLLGDIVEDGIVNASDKLEMNKKLNGLANLPGITLRDLDLSGDGALVNAEDKLAINQVLNGLIVP